MAAVVIGCDIGKATVAVAAWVGSKATSLGSVANTAAGYTELGAKVATVRHQAGAAGVHVVLEPTGGYELGLASWACGQGWTVSLPNPKQVRDWATGMGIRAKTDQVDAKMLAQYGAQGPVRPWQPLPPAIAALERLLARQADLAPLRQAERNRRAAVTLDADMPAAGVTSLDTSIAALEQALTTLQDAITAHVRAQPELQATVDRLLTVPGIGERTVLWVVVLLQRWLTHTSGAGTAKGLVAYVGLDPRPHQSGSSIHKWPRISKAGNATFRRTLYLCALGGARGHNVLRSFYQQLVGRGKPKKLARIAAARKILVWAWAVFRSQTPFDPVKAMPPAPVAP